MFESIVPGVIPHHAESLAFTTLGEHGFASRGELTSQFYGEHGIPSAETVTLSANSVQPLDIEPLVPLVPGEPLPKDVTCYNLQCLLDYLVSQVTKVQWKGQKESMQLKCFHFLFDQFKKVYVGEIFKELDGNYSLYKASFELPGMRAGEEDLSHDLQSLARRELLANAKAVVIRWLAKYLSNEVEALPRQPAIGAFGQSNMHPSGDHAYNANEWREPTPFEFDVVRSTLNSNRANVNLTHELFRQAFLLPFTQSMTMRRVVAVYKDWINKNTSEVPLFMEEPANDSSEHDVRVGLSKVLRAFITNAANIFLMIIPKERPLLLEEQVDMCKRILNIYRFMVMKVEMDKETW